MGVHGLWRLIEPSGKPVPLETLENKVLAVDISIWLHQAIKGFQDSKGAALPNAHLLGIYHRICKLLFFKIKPIFVFDGGVPALKKQTIAKRNQSRSETLSEADKIQKQLLNALLKHSAISKVLSDKAKAELAAPLRNQRTEKDDLYKLPPSKLETSLSDEESETSAESSPTKQWDLHTIDTESKHFKSLPVDIRHEILTELKETRKQSSWGRLHELPTQSDDFAVFQMQRLLKRNSVQTALEQAEQEMGGHSLSLGELEALLNEQGVITNNDKIGNRIASDENTRYLLIKDVQKAMEEAKKQLEKVEEAPEEDSLIEEAAAVESKSKADLEFEEDLRKAIALSMQDNPSTSSTSQKNYNNKEFSFMESLILDSDESEDDFDSITTVKDKVLSSAQNYMKEYSGLTPNEIEKIINQNDGKEKYTKSAQAKSKIDSTKIETSNQPSKEKNVPENISKSPNLSQLSEDSEDSDFEEVENPPDNSEDAMEIVINPNAEAEDDLFSDIFQSNPKEDQKSEPEPTPKVVEESSNKIETSCENNKKEKETVTIIETSINNNKTEKLQEKKVESENKIEILSKYNINPNVKEKELEKIKETALVEQENLITEISSKERMAANITDQMYQESQELLQLFGVPYIIAPMEAEAQCAFLEANNLTDGSITDDSDIWLFGGKTVYKNFFNQSKYVLEFHSKDIEHHFKLSREQMILLALLVGSDYTVGLSGVGPVTAMEILAAFPPRIKGKVKLTEAQLLSGLREFRSWYTKGQTAGPGRNALKNKLKHLSFSDNFPNLNVVQAYLDPTVDGSKEGFSWSKPDFIGLVDFAKRKFGWTTQKTEEILNPVLKKLEENAAQKSIRDYFKTTHVFDSGKVNQKMSHRVRAAIDKFGKDPNDILDEPKKTTRKKKLEGTPNTKTGKKKCTKKDNLSKDAPNFIGKIPDSLKSDEEIKILLETAHNSEIKVENINVELEKKLESITESKEKPVKMIRNVHKKEVIPQKERDKNEMLRSKLKAIEVFRKSKKGPGQMKKRAKTKIVPSEDANLSESD